MPFLGRLAVRQDLQVGNHELGLVFHDPGAERVLARHFHGDQSDRRLAPFTGCVDETERCHRSAGQRCGQAHHAIEGVLGIRVENLEGLQRFQAG